MSERGFLGGAGAGGGFATASTTVYFPPVGRAGLSSISASATESLAQMKVRGAATLRNGHGRVSSNGRSTTTTIKGRVNGADTNVSVSIGAGQTGVFADTSNTAALADGDLLCWAGTTGTGTGSITLDAFTSELTTTGAAFAHVGVGLSTPGVTIATASTTLFVGPGGLDRTAIEARAQYRAPGSATLSNLLVNVASNARLNTTTFRCRKNGANGNQSVAISAGSTGIFEDTSNSDTMVAGDLGSTGITTGAGTEALVFTVCSMKRVGANNASLLAVVLTGVSLAAATTAYQCAAGAGPAFSTTESNHAFPAPFPATIMNGGAVVSANASTTDVTLVMRKGGVDQALVITVTALTSGTFTDTTHSFHVDRTDLVNWKGSGATTGGVTFGGLSALMVADAVLAAANLTIGSPEFGAPAIAQAHQLAAAALATGALAFGAATLAQAHQLSAAALALASPTFGLAALAQAHQLAAPALDLASPSFGLAVLAQTHALTAPPIATGAPDFGAQPIGQRHQLVAGGVVVGGPVFGSAVLLQLRLPKARLTGAPRRGRLTGVANRDQGS